MKNSNIETRLVILAIAFGVTLNSVAFSATNHSGCLSTHQCSPDFPTTNTGTIKSSSTTAILTDTTVRISISKNSYEMRSRKIKRPPPAPEPSLTEVPELLDNLYRYNVNGISDLVTYQQSNGNLIQLFTYWNENRRLMITQRNFPNGEFSAPIDITVPVMGTEETLRYDSHNTTAVGVAENGVMFVTGNHHVSQLNMAKSTTPYNLNSFAPMLPEKMVSAAEVDRITYPSFFRHGQYLYFSYREQEVGQNASRFRWMINRYDPERDEWTTAVQFNTGINLRLYVSNIAVEQDGGSMHVFGLWRDDAEGNGVASQRDYFHLYSTDGTNWRIKNSNTVITANQHLWYDNGDDTLPGYSGIELTADEKIWSTNPDPLPRQAGVATADNNGTPHALVKDIEGDLHYHYWRAKRYKRWESIQLTGWSAQSYDIVSCPSNIAALISDQNDKIYYRSLDPSDGSHNTPILLADGFITGDYTLSVDKEAIKHGYVSFLLTRNSHFPPLSHDPTVISNPQPAWIATFHCNQLDNATAFNRID